MTGEIVKSENLREGMIVNKFPDAERGFEIIPARNGFCEKGFHFGNGCYDRIAEWFVYESRGNAQAPQDSVGYYRS